MAANARNSVSMMQPEFGAVSPYIMPKLANAHSAQMVEEFISLGWATKYQFRADGDSEPYEYVLEWQRGGDAP